MNSEKKAPVLTENEFRRAVATARTHEQASRNVTLLYFSVALGLRAKEMSQLLVRDVLTTDGKIKDEVLLTRATTKGRKQRLIYLTNKDVRKALTAYFDERRKTEAIPLHPESPLFKSRKGSRFSR